MEKEKLDKANEIQRRINFLNMIKTRIDNKDNLFNVMLGISIHGESGPFLPIGSENDLNKQLIEITKKHYEKILPDLQQEFDKL